MKRRFLKAKSIEIYKNDVKVKYKQSNKPPEGNKRKEVKNLSEKSLKKLAFTASNTSVTFDRMITLTYPNSFPMDGELSKRHLASFVQWMRRRIRPFSYLWFLEFQKRGAPHYHVVFSSRGVFVDKDDVAGAWYKIVASGDEKHLYAGTRTEAVRSKGGLSRYVVKYAMKAEQKAVPVEYRSVGRFWGCSRDVTPKMLGKVKVSRYIEVAAALSGIDREQDALVNQWSTLYGASSVVIKNTGVIGGGVGGS